MEMGRGARGRSRVTRLRRLHFAGARGDVLDVGCGTGENFRHLVRASSITALDLSPQMLAHAERRARRLGLDVSIHLGDAAALPFVAASFDTVVSAMSTCTFPDYAAAFSEMMRVTRPGGRLLLFEHGRSSVAWVARRQDRAVERHFETTACRSNRGPVSDLSSSGLVHTELSRSYLGMAYRITVDVT